MKSLAMISILLLFSCTEDVTDTTGLEQGLEIVKIQKKAPNLGGLKRAVLVEDDAVESHIKNISEIAFRFPSINASPPKGEVDWCVEKRRPSLCEWAEAAQDVVLLEVRDVYFVTFPSRDAATGEIVQECDGKLFPPLKIEGVIGKSLSGNTGSISIEIGYEQYERWNVWPYVNGLGALTWSNDYFKIDVGSQIGLTLYKVPSSGVYSVLGEPFFQLDTNQAIEFSDFPQKCRRIAPLDVSGLTFGELKTRAQRCLPSKGIDARILEKAALWKERKFIDLGVCIKR